MKTCTFYHLGLICLLLIFGTNGCQTVRISTVKTRGVYTTLAVPEPDLDLPASGYMQKSSFGPGENPAAVVVGYGEDTQPQLLTLELVELSTGRSLWFKDYDASYGKALVQPLAIRLSGNYKVRLMVGGTEFDACQFTVTRTNNSGTTQAEDTNPGTNYAQGIFSVSVESASSSTLFEKYDDQLDYAMVNSVTPETDSTNLSLFVQ